jgi:hypothetical protein
VRRKSRESVRSKGIPPSTMEKVAGHAKELGTSYALLVGISLTKMESDIANPNCIVKILMRSLCLALP